MRKCQTCKKNLPKNSHPNRLRCKPCATKKRKHPTHNLTKSQQRKALSLAGKIYRDKIAEEIGCSRSALMRFAREHKDVNWNALKYDPKTIQEVTEYYIEHGKRATQERFPDVKVRSIVERYLAGIKARQVRWTSKQLIEAMQMGGLIPFYQQARYFNRPGANAGSIRSLWVKKFKGKQTTVNGLHYNIAKNFVTKSCPFYAVRLANKGAYQWIALWVDVYDHRKDDLPNHIESVFEVMKNFQIWLHGRNPKKKIEAMIKDREQSYG